MDAVSEFSIFSPALLSPVLLLYFLSQSDKKWGCWDSNPEPTDYESAALTN